MNKKIFFFILVILLLSVPVFSGNVVDNFIKGVKEQAKDISDQFYNWDENLQNNDNLITGKAVQYQTQPVYYFVCGQTFFYTLVKAEGDNLGCQYKWIAFHTLKDNIVNTEILSRYLCPNGDYGYNSANSQTISGYNLINCNFNGNLGYVFIPVVQESYRLERCSDNRGYLSLFGNTPNPDPKCGKLGYVFTSPGCVPNWQCGSWNTCLSSGTQTRTCTDTNNCGVVCSDQNICGTSTTCTYTPPASSVGSPLQANNLVLHYDFEQTPIKDKSSYANDVTNQYGGSIVQGKIGNGIYFGGLFQKLEVVNSQSLDITGNKITIMAWVKMENLGSDYPLSIAKKKIDDRSIKYALISIGSVIDSQFTTSSGSFSGNSQIPINSNIWYHVAVIYNGDTSELISYLNGQEKQRIGLTGNFAATNLNYAHFVVGRDSIVGRFDSPQDSEIAKGTIDELKIYNTVLSAQEILNEFNYNNPTTTGTTTGTGGTTGTGTGTTNTGGGTTPTPEQTLTCSVSETLFKISSVTNAHAALFDYSEYDNRICLPGSNIQNRICNTLGNNIIIKLSQNFNAHIEKPNLNNYNTKICSNDVSCAYKTSCSTGEVCVASISSDTNAHISGVCDTYPTKLCCGNPICSENTCENLACSSQTICEDNGCNWNSDRCCPPGKIWNSNLNKCDYDPNGKTIELVCGTKDERFEFKGQICKIVLTQTTEFPNGDNNVQISVYCNNNLIGSRILTVGPSEASSYYSDFDLDNNNEMNLRIQVDRVPEQCKAVFTYIVSESGGLCSSTSCKTNKDICNKGYGYCTIGTTCTFWPPNSPNGRCCLEGEIWDTVEGKCIDFRSGSCSALNTYQPNSPPYSRACCPAGRRSGFWFDIKTY